MATLNKSGFDDELEGNGVTDAELVTRSNLLDNVRKSDPEAAIQRMAQRMLGAQTIDDLFSSTKGVTSDQLEGKSIEVTGVEWQEYEASNGPIPLAIVTAIDLIDGDEFEFATTATMLVTFLYQADAIGVIPFKARITGKQTRSGATALNFERI